MNSQLDIVIVSYNTRDLLMTCLDSIRAYTPAPLHIYVVDNASVDGTLEALSKLRWDFLHIIQNPDNRGYARACNQGIREGTSPYVLLLNSDVIVTVGWLDPLLDCMAQDDRIAVVGPKMINQRGQITSAGIIGTYDHHFPRGYLERDEPGKFEVQEDCFSVCGAAYLIRRGLIPILGLLDEHYFFYFEETDYSLHARQQGYRVVYCPASKIYHLSGQSNKNHSQLRAYFEESERYFRTKWAHLRQMN